MHDYLYLEIDGDHWHTTNTSDKFKCEPAPPGMVEAVDMWFKIDFKFAGMSIVEFMRSLGVEL